MVGPIEPATNRGRVAVENSSAACRASRAASFILLVDAVFEPVFGQDYRGAAERVRLDDVGARFQVAAMYVEHDVGPREDEVLVAAFQVRAAEILRRQVALLNRGARRAVKHEDALGQQLFQHLCCCRLHISREPYDLDSRRCAFGSLLQHLSSVSPAAPYLTSGVSRPGARARRSPSSGRCSKTRSG